MTTPPAPCQAIRRSNENAIALGHPGRHSVAAETRARRGLHSPKILAPNLHRTDSVLTAASLSAPATRRPPAHAACPISLPASNASPLFQTASVMAAILR